MMKALNKQTVEKPALPVKIMQFGEGNFLRAFVDWQIHKANEAGVMNHGVAVVQPIAQGMTVALNSQDCMYHVVLEGIRDQKPVREITLVKSIVRAVNPYEDYASYETLFLSPDLEMIISNTTEAGIRYQAGDDITAMPPESYPAKITALLHKRWRKFDGATDKGLLIICCELIEDNGSTLREYVLKHAGDNNLSPGFVNWVKTGCYFYNTIVDRIVTGFPREDINEIKAETGFDDNMVVKGEYFHVWAIGGDPVIREKLPLDKAGLNVLFMEDIRPFRSKKVRILNGAHTVMTPIALQMGCDTVLEAFREPGIEQFVRTMLDTEILPVIDENAGELQSFTNKILERFYNPYLKHYLKDISLNSLSKWETRCFPSLLDNYRAGKHAPFLTFSFAALLALYSGQSEAKDFSPRDTPEFVEFIQTAFDRCDLKTWVKAVCENRKIWKEDLTAVAYFVDEVTRYAELIFEKGIRRSLLYPV